MKVTTPNAKVLVVGTPVQYQKWVSKFGSKIAGVNFILVTKPEHFKSRHRKNTRVMVLSDPKNLQEKVGDKINRLNPIDSKGVEEQIAQRERKQNMADNAIGWFRETSMGEKVEVPSE